MNDIIDSHKLHDLIRAWLVSGKDQDFAEAYAYADSGPNDVDYDGGDFCPWGEALHFHHDGCPCCSMYKGVGIDDEEYKRRMYNRYGVTQQELNHV